MARRKYGVEGEEGDIPSFLGKNGKSLWDGFASDVRGEEAVTRWGRGTNWRDRPKTLQDPRIRLPICPYGCGEEGQLKEIVMGEGGQAVGIYADSDGCVFRADIQLGEPPTKRKLVLGPDGELKEEEN